MTPRIHVDRPLAQGDAFELPPAQARHVQVLRLQPGAALTLFDGRGGEWQARVLRMGRGAVEVAVDARVEVERELAHTVTLALGMPANERMDALIEKATELGVAAVQPLVCERSVLRLAGARAAKRVEHWQAVAVAASEQCGRTRVPQVRAVQTFAAWLGAVDAAPASATHRYLLSPDAAQQWNRDSPGPERSTLLFLSGPEGGLAPAEEAAARGAGFVAVSLGPRVLRADTAPLAVLACCGLTETTMPALERKPE
ncbi:MAG: 16S rRNA (uracil(1498)-N(3))-methyltransferase [Caldimonas sp.]